MGNTVSAAEKVAANIIHPNGGEPNISKHQHVNYSKGGAPPPECPMHQKQPEQKVLTTECPIGYGKDEVNPLNMVQTKQISKITDSHL